MKERSLVAFTLLAQLCVGTFLILGFLDLLGSSAITAAPAHFSLLSRCLPGIGFLFALALSASLFHLGTPGNAYRAIVNWRSSWLSREILFSLAFAGALVLFAFITRIIKASPSLLLILFLLAVLCGLALIYVMARVYMLRTVDVWNRWTTPLSFYSAAIFLGSLAAGVTVLFTGESISMLPWLGGLALLAFGIETLIWLPLLMKRQAVTIPWNNSLEPLPHPALRLGLAAAGLLAYELGIFTFSGENAGLLLALAGLAVASLSELLTRSLFYRLRQAQNL